MADEQDVLTRAELDAIAERAAKATPGPWVVGVEQGAIRSTNRWPRTVATVEPDELDYNGVAGADWRPEHAADTAFIAAARQDIPRLLATVEALYEIVVRIDPTLCPFHCIPRVVSGSDRDDQGIGTNWYEHAKDCPIPHALLSC